MFSQPLVPHTHPRTTLASTPTPYHHHFASRLPARRAWLAFAPFLRRRRRAALQYVRRWAPNVPLPFYWNALSHSFTLSV